MGNHAIENAKGWLETVREMVANLAEEASEGEARDWRELEEAREAIQEAPLSVQVRGDWHNPGAEQEREAPAEYQVLLTTGGPALRIVGELDRYAQPASAVLQWQDWGTPWTDYLDTSDDDVSALLAFVSQLYFGE